MLEHAETFLSRYRQDGKPVAIARRLRPQRLDFITAGITVNKDKRVYKVHSIYYSVLVYECVPSSYERRSYRNEW